ncbi:DNA replication protein DnaD [Paenibacillus yonginensis]|uniref:DNA replication protein DnaD n=1 Tax=Paenibacillus yonginensis TaxID=1462996 RepID=A0A1B1N063_9BACL|nr:DnaD domain protein [Paenibacillus yonginensis]ANS74817.1 DNA replication protein DnaD [Paenibacillus yonginensis]
MAMNEGWKVWANGIAYGMENGTVNVPAALLAYYRRLKLSDMEAMLLIHLLHFRQSRGSEFPPLAEIEQVMSTSPGAVASAVRKLIKDGWLTIDQVTDEQTGVQSEHYHLNGMYKKLSLCLAEHFAAERKELRLSREQLEEETAEMDSAERNLFITFEQEFARPLSPMECETISGWIDQDGYPEELIRLALKEAVFAGKIHFRYIDRILLEWSRNRVRNAEEARAYTQRFRGTGNANKG